MKPVIKIISALLFTISLLNFTSLEAETTANVFAKGGDISWLPEMEKESNFKFYNDNGVAQDCFQILKDHGFNTIRLRTWVNPSMVDWKNGHCSKYETVAMAVRAKKWGMRIMIDFHYSDTWADPAHQIKPAAWASHTFPVLLTDVYNYTYGVMTALDSAGITPEWVQIGNETSPGMLLPDGSTNNWGQLAQLINKGYDAVKAVSPTTKVVLHVDDGSNNSRFRWWFDNAKNYGAKYDVIGMSYYPYWLTGSPDYKLSINDLGNNLNDMVSRYGKEVMVVEVGGLDTNPQNTKDMLIAVINKVLAVPKNAGLGVLYWEPQGSRSWTGYNLSAWEYGTNPKPSIALDAFLTPTALAETPDTRITLKVNNQNGTLEFNEELSSIELTNMNGLVVSTGNNTAKISVGNLAKGVYVIRAKSFTSNIPSVFKCIL